MKKKMVNKARLDAANEIIAKQNHEIAKMHVTIVRLEQFHERASRFFRALNYAAQQMEKSNALADRVSDFHHAVLGDLRSQHVIKSEV